MPKQAPFPWTRLRRLRQSPALRSLTRETDISIQDLILPLFIKAGELGKQAIASMPGHFQFGLDAVVEEAQAVQALGIPGVILFGIPATKDAMGTAACDPNGIVQAAIKAIKVAAPQLLVISDLCFCEYTDHGHCGVLQQDAAGWTVDNDRTLALLAQQAVSHAQAGADVIAPSGMMDGMVGAIRQGLDAAGFMHTPILSYAAKYSSALYGPFREAAESTPQMGDRKGYQMDPANAQQALRETDLDMQEGADMLMVKPAGAYLDVIYRVKQAHPGVPLAAYQVSGEYAMIKAAAEKGWIDGNAVALESLLAIKRAGADFIITYFAKELAEYFSSLL